VFTVGAKVFLLALGTPSAKSGLIIANHRFIVKQDVVNVAVYQWLFDGLKLGPKRRWFSGIGLSERVGGTRATKA